MHIKLRLATAVLLAAALPAFAQNTAALVSNQDVQQTLQELKQLILQQSQQIQHQQEEIDELKHQRPEATTIPAPIPAPTPAPAAQSAVAVSTSVSGGAVAPQEPNANSSVAQAEPNGTPYHQYEQPSPLFLKLGSATFTPGGWIDFTSIYRTTDVGSGFTTALATIPFNNTLAGGLSENRLTAANSRLSLRVDENIGKVKVYGYGEIDFNGTAPGNVYVSTNSDVTRLRVFYLNITAGKWDILGGQSWSLLTPNRSGLSPFLSEIYNTVHLDTAYNAGIVYARQAQLRVVYHFTPNVALGISAENPQQFTGAAVTFPTNFTTADQAQVDLNSSSASNTVPNLHPDVVAKIAYDHKFGTRNWHVETAGLLTSVAISTPATTTAPFKPSVEDRREGGGVALNTNLELIKGLHLIADSFWSDGGGRYIGGLGPQFVVAQHGSTTAPFTAELEHAGAGLGGFEYQATKSTLLSAIYGGAYFDRNSSIDPTNNKLVGYGFAGSPATNNRFIQEGSFATVTNVFRKPSYGSVQVITQFSYIERTPWSVAPNSPKNAHLFENYFDIRYVLP
jgi:hypothetical protein